jgi:hypothetical protein
MIARNLFIQLIKIGHRCTHLDSSTSLNVGSSANPALLSGRALPAKWETNAHARRFLKRSIGDAGEFCRFRKM